MKRRNACRNMQCMSKDAMQIFNLLEYLSCISSVKTNKQKNRTGISAPVSGSAMVPCALGQEIFLHPCQQNLQSLKWKKAAKISKMQNLFFFEGNKPNLVSEMNFDKVVIVGESNNAGVWRRSPQPPEDNGGSGAKPSTLKRFFTSFFKEYAFLSILWSKLLLKMRF